MAWRMTNKQLCVLMVLWFLYVITTPFRIVYNFFFPEKAEDEK